MPADATATEIREAYRRQARIHHPDARGASSSPAMAAINEAHRVLSDPGRRLDYDRQLRAASSATDGSKPRPDPVEEHVRPRIDPMARYIDPPRFPWRFVLFAVVLGSAVVLTVGAFSEPGDPPPIDNLLVAGDCVVIEPLTSVAGETTCADIHDAVVVTLVPSGEQCPSDTEGYRDRQGLGTACVRRP